MANREEVRAYIPEDNAWHDADMKAKADDLGMKKSDFILKAVDMMINFDLDFYKRIEQLAAGLQIPAYLVMQNMLIKDLAMKDARRAVYGSTGDVLDEFIFQDLGDGFKILTGADLEKALLEKYTREEKHKLDEINARRNR